MKCLHGIEDTSCALCGPVVVAELREKLAAAREDAAEQERGRLLHEALHNSWRYKCQDARDEAVKQVAHCLHLKVAYDDVVRERERLAAENKELQRLHDAARREAPSGLGALDLIHREIGGRSDETTLDAVRRLAAELKAANERADGVERAGAEQTKRADQNAVDCRRLAAELSEAEQRAANHGLDKIRLAAENAQLRGTLRLVRTKFPACNGWRMDGCDEIAQIVDDMLALKGSKP